MLCLYSLDYSLSNHMATDGRLNFILTNNTIFYILFLQAEEENVNIYMQIDLLWINLERPHREQEFIDN